MKLWLIVPVKPFTVGKSRLAGALPAAERALLSRRMLHHVLARAAQANVLAGALVVSQDATVLDGVSWSQVAFVQERGEGLNRALEQGRQQALAWGADAILVLPADLPLLTADDIRGLYRLATNGTGIVIAPSADGGTNALLLRPATALRFAFGLHSFAYHCALAQLAGLPCQLFQSSTLSFDLDSPTDLATVTPLPAAVGANAALPHPCT